MRSGNITMKRATAKINRFPKPSVAKAKERAPLAEQAYREIKRRILDNEFSPGTTILEQELALLLRMSRTPVREAAVRLAEEGLVEVRPRHGMRGLGRVPPRRWYVGFFYLSERFASFLGYTRGAGL